MKCSKCDQDSVIKQGHVWLCEKHYRFGSMKSKARASGKTVPTQEWLEENAPKGMQCPVCKRKMNWRQRDGASTVITLQHNRDGSFSLICLACNVRHASFDGDSFYEVPVDHRVCYSCKKTLHIDMFYTASVGRWKNRMSICKECSDKKTEKWRIDNREAFNAKQREYRRKRRESGNPIRR